MRSTSRRGGVVVRALCWWLVSAGVLGTPLLLAADKTEELEKSKLRAELKSMVKRLATAKGPALDKVSQRFVELDSEGVPVKRMLCEVVGGQSGLAVENALGVLEKLSPTVAGNARFLAGPPQSSSSTHAAVFEYYHSTFNELNREKELDVELSAVLREKLISLARFGNRSSTSATSTRNDATYEKKHDTYEIGVKILHRLAKKDDAALGDLLVLVAQPIKSFSDDESSLRDEALEGLGTTTGADAKRAEMAVPVISAALRSAFAPSKVPQSPLTEFAAGLGAYSLAERSLQALGEIGPNASTAAPLVRQLRDHPRLGSQAKAALSKIGG